jgi:hypothetical protein
VTDVIFAAIGLLMLGALLFISGSVSREDPRLRRRWDARFDHEAHELRRTDATGVLRCRRCGASGSERSGVCPGCGATL